LPSTANSEAARLLVQASFGPTAAEINRVASIGIPAWIDQQFTTAPLETHRDYINRNSGDFLRSLHSFWRQAITGPDQLRQRVAFSLSEIFVVSNVNGILGSQEVDRAAAAYLDMLAANAFGTFRQLLEAVTRNTYMGLFLSHMRNLKEDGATGRIPDENYAREVMQLFSIGLWELNPDGSRKLDSSGQPIPTYGQEEISGMARVFTGLSFGGGPTTDGTWFGFDTANTRWDLPMQMYPQYHSTSEKRIIGGVRIPANTSGDESLRITLDALANHPNVGPFIGEQLIKRLVTSNPSRAYVGRVAAVFNNNGSGVRGDMKAVIRAVLLDTEARDNANIGRDDWGKVREPIVRFANWLRAFDVRATSGKFQIIFLEDPVDSIGQSPLGAPSVFNYFRPDYAAPGPISVRRLVSPEFQITHDTTVTGYINFVGSIADFGYRRNGSDPLIASYATETALAATPDVLLDRLNLLLLAGRMTDPTRSLIRNAVQSLGTDGNNLRFRVALAVMLVMVSPEFIVQK
jgi:uncharacterized protein (DUF1800 family)